MALEATLYVREVFRVLVKPVNVPVEHDLHVLGVFGCDEGVNGIECEGIAVEPSDNCLLYTSALLIKAIGKNLICVHVNHGLMRKGESEQVVDVFQNQMDANLVLSLIHIFSPGPIA